VNAAVFTPTGVPALADADDDRNVAPAAAWGRRNSRTNDGQMIKDKTTVTGDQALELVLHE